MKSLLRTALVAGALTITGVAVVAQDSRPTDSVQPAVVRTGEYRDLTLARKFKMGTAPYVNPALVKRTAVAFKYDVESMKKLGDPQNVLQDIKAGKLGVAYIADGEYIVKSIPEFAEYGEYAEMLADLKASGDFVFVSAADSYRGVANSGAVVSWDPGPPVRRTDK
jgi:hypothetical protein